MALADPSSFLEANSYSLILCILSDPNFTYKFSIR